MKIARIKNFDISNGEGIGVAVYVSGCHFHCPGCFNQEAWDPNYGEPYDLEKIMKLLANPDIDHLSILGGEPMEHTMEVTEIMQEARRRYPNKKIWLWTGLYPKELNEAQRKAAELADFVTYGRFIYEKRNISRKYRGSDNQYTISRNGKIIEGGKE